MRCEDLQDYFTDYVEDSLDVPLRSQVLEHLESCAPCRVEADALRSIWSRRGDLLIDRPDSPAMRARYDRMVGAYKQTRDFAPSGTPRRRHSLRRQLVQILVAMTLLGIVVFAAQHTGLIVMMKAPEPVKLQDQTRTAALPPQIQVASLKSSIEGVVLRAGTNEPVANAQVSAFWAAPPLAYQAETVPRAMTDREGKFIIQDVDPGAYRVSVSARAYAPQTYGARVAGPGGAGSGSVIDALAGQRVKDVVFHLTPASVISGRITTANGEPLLGMEVVVLRVSYDVHGWRSLTAETSRALTNDRGEYRVSGISPGRYYLRAGSSSEVNGDMPVARRDYEGLPAPFSYGKYKTVYYPQESDISTASFVEVQEGTERVGTNFVLSRQFERRRVRGWVVDPSGAALPPQARVRLDPYGVYLAVIGGGVVVNPDGSFDIKDVVPGTYWASVDIPKRLTPELQQLIRTPGVDFTKLPAPDRGRTLLTVGDSNVDNVVVTIARDLSVAGSIRVDGEPSSTPAGLDGIKIEFLPIGGGAPGPNLGDGRVEPDGMFLYKNIWPGEYLLSIRGLPVDAYLKEARLGDVDVLTRTVQITEPVSVPLNLVLGSKGGMVDGTLAGPRAMPLAGKQIVLIPDQLPRRRDLYKTATADRNGRFTIRGIAPGEYKLYAWQNMESYRYFDADFVKQFETDGTAVRISETAPVTTTLQLIP